MTVDEARGLMFDAIMEGDSYVDVAYQQSSKGMFGNMCHIHDDGLLMEKDGILVIEWSSHPDTICSEDDIVMQCVKQS